MLCSSLTQLNNLYNTKNKKASRIAVAPFQKESVHRLLAHGHLYKSSKDYESYEVADIPLDTIFLRRIKSHTSTTPSSPDKSARAKTIPLFSIPTSYLRITVRSTVFTEPSLLMSPETAALSLYTNA